MTEKKEHTLGKFWGMAFGSWFVGFLAFELLFYHVPVWWYFLGYIGGCWLTLEMFGAAKKRKRGDTWSEMMWWFGEKGPARRILTVCITEAIVFRAGSLAWLEAGIVNDFIRYTPWLLVFLGIGGWVYFHIGKQNRYG